MTYHSIERTKERAHLKTNGAIKLITNAYEKGKNAPELPAKERRYLLSKEKHGTKTKFFSGYCFIFSEAGECITMYLAPSWFLKKTNFVGKESIKNQKKYFNNYYQQPEYLM